MNRCFVSKCLLGMASLSLFIACKKSSGGNTAPPSQPTLTGTWTTIKYIAANFNSSGGRPYIPNDTIYPIHTETQTFTKDSSYWDTWETFSYNGYVGGTFSNTQNTEFTGSAAYTATSSFIVMPRYAPNDTTFIVSLTDSVLVLQSHVYIGLGVSGGILYDIYSYARRQ